MAPTLCKDRDLSFTKQYPLRPTCICLPDKLSLPSSYPILIQTLHLNLYLPFHNPCSGRKIFPFLINQLKSVSLTLLSKATDSLYSLWLGPWLNTFTDLPVCLLGEKENRSCLLTVLNHSFLDHSSKSIFPLTLESSHLPFCTVTRIVHNTLVHKTNILFHSNCCAFILFAQSLSLTWFYSLSQSFLPLPQISTHC